MTLFLKCRNLLKKPRSLIVKWRSAPVVLLLFVWFSPLNFFNPSIKSFCLQKLRSSSVPAAPPLHKRLTSTSPNLSQPPNCKSSFCNISRAVGMWNSACNRKVTFHSAAPMKEEKWRWRISVFSTTAVTGTKRWSGKQRRLLSSFCSDSSNHVLFRYLTSIRTGEDLQTVSHAVVYWNNRAFSLLEHICLRQSTCICPKQP